MNQVPVAESFRGKRRLLFALLLIGAISIVTTLLVGSLAPARSELRRQLAFSWLFAFLYFFTILIGCFFWIILHHSTDSGWGILVRRQMENLASLIPYMAIFFIPWRSCSCEGLVALRSSRRVIPASLSQSI